MYTRARRSFLKHFNYLDADGNRNGFNFFGLRQNSELTEQLIKQAENLQLNIKLADSCDQIIAAIIECQIEVYWLRLSLSNNTKISDKGELHQRKVHVSEPKGRFEKELVQGLLGIVRDEKKPTPDLEPILKEFACLAARIEALPNTIEHAITDSWDDITLATKTFTCDIYRHFLVYGVLEKNFNDLFILSDKNAENLRSFSDMVLLKTKRAPDIRLS